MEQSLVCSVKTWEFIIYLWFLFPIVKRLHRITALLQVLLGKLVAIAAHVREWHGELASFLPDRGDRSSQTLCWHIIYFLKVFLKINLDYLHTLCDGGILGRRKSLFYVFHLPLQILNNFGEFVDHHKCDQSKREAKNSECIHIDLG